MGLGSLTDDALEAVAKGATLGSENLMDDALGGAVSATRRGISKSQKVMSDVMNTSSKISADVAEQSVKNKGFLGQFTEDLSSFGDDMSTITSRYASTPDMSAGKVAGLASESFSNMSTTTKGAIGYAGANVGLRGIRGGGVLSNPEGDFDIAGVPMF